MEKQRNWRTPVIAIDFDGCLCKEGYPEVGTPNWEVINEAKRLQQGGACLILWTCRQGKPLEAAVEACRSWGLEFDAVNENPKFMIDLFGNDCRKVGADEYWDDRSVWMGGESGGWRTIRGASITIRSREKIRSFINDALRPEIDRLLQRDTALEAMGSPNRDYGNLAILLRECLEQMEFLMAMIDERNEAHSWYKHGYKDATENAASWITQFIQSQEQPDGEDGGEG